MKKLLLIIAILLTSACFAPNADAAISFSKECEDWLDNGTSLTIACAPYSATTTNGYAIIDILEWASDKMNTPTVGGDNASLVQKFTDANSNRHHQYIFPLGDDVSSKNYVFGLTSSGYLDVTIIIVSGAAQTGQPDAFSSGTDSGTPFQIPLTTVADNTWMFAQGRNTSAGTAATCSSNCVYRNNTLQGWNIYRVDTGSAQAAGSNEIVMNGTAAQNQGFVVLSIEPAAEGGGGGGYTTGLRTFIIN